MSDTTQIPQATLTAATTRDALPQARITLLGTLHGPDTARALVRIGRDRIVTIEAGGALESGTVAAIGEGVLILSRGGQSERLEMPPV